MALSSLSGSVRCRARPQRLRASAAPRASAAAQSAGASVPVGSRVRVKDSIVVYHVPKQKTGLTLQARPRTCHAAPHFLAARCTRCALAGLDRLPRCRAA